MFHPDLLNYMMRRNAISEEKLQYTQKIKKAIYDYKVSNETFIKDLIKQNLSRSEIRKTTSFGNRTFKRLREEVKEEIIFHIIRKEDEI
jgi:nicotinic acid mononucleotide adenylyltransferase